VENPPPLDVHPVRSPVSKLPFVMQHGTALADTVTANAAAPATASAMNFLIIEPLRSLVARTSDSTASAR
jgi:hypothetical protein